MPYLVLGYPELKPKDFEVIQKYRKLYDPQFIIVNPHFTFVFPVHSDSENNFVSEIRKQTAGFSKIELTLQKAIVHKDELSEFYSVFLSPEKGSEAIALIHDKLYSGSLRKFLLSDIPFVPHITIGKSMDKTKCERIAGDWNGNKLSIQSSITELAIVKYENNLLTSIGTICSKINTPDLHL